MSLHSIMGLRVIESTALPIEPSDSANVRRIVRHGLADIIAWCLPEEEIGPEPGELTHVLIIGQNVHASATLVGLWREDGVLS